MKKSSDEYENVPTAIDGVELRVVRDTRPDIPVEIIQLFLNIARSYVGNKEAIDLNTAENKGLKERILKYVKSMPGFRGISSVSDDFMLLAVKKEDVTWDTDFLKASLGTAYQALVAEEFVATVTIPPGLISEEKLCEGLERLLKEIGVPLADIPKLLATETTLRIDTEKLDELVEAKRVKLLPGTKDVEEKWAINVDPLKLPQKRKVGKKKG
ncbi:MAG: hypothetical protein Q8N21_01885 [bacterium]|nr:hypothetical protein [bacterium]